MFFPYHFFNATYLEETDEVKKKGEYKAVILSLDHIFNSPKNIKRYECLGSAPQNSN